MSAAAVRKRNQQTVQEKYKIIQAYEQRKTELENKSTLVRELDLPSISSWNSILAKKDKILHEFTSNFTMQMKRFKPSTFSEIDQELYQWFFRMSEVVEGEQVPGEITEVDEISEVIVSSRREAYLVLKTAQTYFCAKITKKMLRKCQICWKSW